MNIRQHFSPFSEKNCEITVLREFVLGQKNLDQELTSTKIKPTHLSALVLFWIKLCELVYVPDSAFRSHRNVVWLLFQLDGGLGRCHRIVRIGMCDVDIPTACNGRVIADQLSIETEGVA